MSGIELTLRHPYAGVLDASVLLPERLFSLSTAAIEQIEVDVGGQKEALGHFFSVSAIESDRLVIQGPVMNSCRWGAEMSCGRLIVECDVGDEVGLGLRGGTIEIRGNVGSHLGCGMRHGSITVAGNAGDYVGAPSLGQRRGMRGGIITIEGNVGQRAGDCMRRGTIIVHGDAGDYLAARMIAGTIAVCGRIGKQAGALMRRGTVWAPQLQPASIVSSFSSGQRVQIPHLALWYRWLASIDTRFSDWAHAETYAHRWLGDAAVQGLGEFLSPIAA